MAMETIYPEKDDPLFAEKIAMMKDFGIFKIAPIGKITSDKAFQERAERLCQFEKTYYQHFVSQYISKRSPYKSLLLYHGLGSGKTCSAITIAETFLVNHRMHEKPTVWVISKQALHQSFQQEVFRTVLLTSPEFLRQQCTGDTYSQMIPDYKKLSNDKLIARIEKIIRSRYQFFGYRMFANMVKKAIADGTLAEKIKNKVVIIDEAHNIRKAEMMMKVETDLEPDADADGTDGAEDDDDGDEGDDAEKKQKHIVEFILKYVKASNGNRLVLLSATPMFNEADEILWLMGLLEMNEKGSSAPLIIDPSKELPQFYKNGDVVPKSFNLIKTLSSKYISHIRGNNPFTFAVRVRPNELGVNILTTTPKLTFNGEPVNNDNWLPIIHEGIVPSVLSGIQLNNFIEMQETKKHLVNMKLRLLNNITYFNHQITKQSKGVLEGEKGLYTIFNRKGSQFRYIDQLKPLLNPAFGQLRYHATKFQTIADMLPKTQGVVVIYSNFIWGGVVPFAIMLEHLGFTRFGAPELLDMPDKAKKRIKFAGVNKPAYCILSGENNNIVMAGSKIDTLLKTVNDTEKNKNGKAVKVILMSPVASEGLTFKNVREIHILDTWYHMNTAEQAIGRAIRHCSHSSLPIEERNVSVFLHACVFPDNMRETEDLHAYRLSAIKRRQIDSVDRVIKANAFDCQLMKHANYYPKTDFEFATVLKTSHGTTIPYIYGDEESQMTQRTAADPPDEKNRDKRAFREESYIAFVPTLQLKLMKYLKEQHTKQHIQEFEYEDLLEVIHPNKEIANKTIEMSLYPYKLWDNYGLIYHQNKFLISEFKKETLRPTRIQITERSEREAPRSERAAPQSPREAPHPERALTNLETLFDSFIDQHTDRAITLLKIYRDIDSISWKIFAEKVVQYPNFISSKIRPIIDILESEGSFVTRSELNVGRTTDWYVGYINIFADFTKENRFAGTILDEGSFREIVPSELTILKLKRRHTPYTDPSKPEKFPILEAIGMIHSAKDSKEKNAPFRFKFKLGLNNQNNQKRTGIVCKDGGMCKQDIIAELERYTNDIDRKNNKETLCFTLMYNLVLHNRMWVPVEYKPIAQSTGGRRKK